MEEASLNLLEAEANALDAIDTAPRPEGLGEENADPLEAGGRDGGRDGGRGNPEDLQLNPDSFFVSSLFHPFFSESCSIH